MRTLSTTKKYHSEKNENANKSYKYALKKSAIKHL